MLTDPESTAGMTTRERPLARRCSRIILYILAAVLALCAIVLSIVQISTFFFPSSSTLFYDLGLYGWYSEQSYHSSNITSPRVSTPKWHPAICDAENDANGLVLRDLHGSSVRQNGVTIVDLKGDLIWSNDSFGHASNLKVQTWRGNEYLTFWAGSRDGGSGQGKYYMLDNEFQLAKTISAVGDGLHGDLHEFEITSDDTALITIYQRLQVKAELTKRANFGSHIIDAIFQEIDISTGRLVFEWRASDHLDGPYLNPIHGHPESSGGYHDIFHINSIEKTMTGDYLVSVRHMHMIICVSGSTGKILWGLGGASKDFLDLSDGKATGFLFQHHARWIDESRGILGLFNNGVAKDHYHDSPYSEGNILDLDVENRTVRLVHSYSSLQNLRSISQGSFQYIDSTNNDRYDNATGDRVFIGWGSSAAWSLYDVESEELLCETHFAASLFFPFEFAKSYRTTLAPPGWKARPAKWSPNAVIKQNKVYVSWNGGMETRWWTLQQSLASKSGTQVEPDAVIWESIETVRKNGFETCIEVPSGPHEGYDVAYRILALDQDKEVLRSSNIIYATPRSSHMASLCFYTVFAISMVASIVFVILQRTRFLGLWRTHVASKQSMFSHQGSQYTRLDDDDIELDGER